MLLTWMYILDMASMGSTLVSGGDFTLLHLLTNTVDVAAYALLQSKLNIYDLVALQRLKLVSVIAYVNACIGI